MNMTSCQHEYDAIFLMTFPCDDMETWRINTAGIKPGCHRSKIFRLKGKENSKVCFIKEFRNRLKYHYFRKRLGQAPGLTLRGRKEHIRGQAPGLTLLGRKEHIRGQEPGLTLSGRKEHIRGQAPGLTLPGRKEHMRGHAPGLTLSGRKEPIRGQASGLTLSGRKEDIKGYRWMSSIQCTLEFVTSSISTTRSQRDGIVNLSADFVVLRHPQVRKTWERAGRTLRFAFRIAKVMAIRSLEIELNLKTFTDLVYQEDQVYKKVGKPKKSLASNVKEATLTLKAQAIMLLPPSERTQEECSLVLCNLQFFDSFRMYPLDIQKNIVLRGHFIALPPGRVLIREGHVAQKWYLVISGQGLVRKTVQEDGPCKMTVDVLSQGMTFGESELEQETKRSFTVMSRQTLHLISLSKADYLFIFCKRMKTRNHNEHLDFLRNIHFMKYWPIERLRNRSFLCYQAYFKINDIVADNSREANAICIIRSVC
ncbi:hypothetical protein C0Q70_10086 [Pomacea canaliculata]|uniref:Cyclic nucleotide-binding domain-containing protein n=1 Tax=Pomacea canaliculata TaxID=400727 RepID=A0A2T7PBL5_POMCA|nr:hypothetical protein C0Q70_10086 [Pomacea canaliculata]